MVFVLKCVHKLFKLTEITNTEKWRVKHIAKDSEG